MEFGGTYPILVYIEVNRREIVEKKYVKTSIFNLIIIKLSIKAFEIIQIKNQLWICRLYLQSVIMTESREQNSCEEMADPITQHEACPITQHDVEPSTIKTSST